MMLMKTSWLTQQFHCTAKGGGKETQTFGSNGCIQIEQRSAFGALSLWTLPGKHERGAKTLACGNSCRVQQRRQNESYHISVIIYIYIHRVIIWWYIMYMYVYIYIYYVFNYTYLFNRIYTMQWTQASNKHRTFVCHQQTWPETATTHNVFTDINRLRWPESHDLMLCGDAQIALRRLRACSRRSSSWDATWDGKIWQWTVQNLKHYEYKWN